MTTATSMGRASPPENIDVSLRAARRGDALHKWVNAKKPGATEVALTDATLVYNIPEGKQVIILSAWLALSSVNDNIKANLVTSDLPDGVGTLTDIDGRMQTSSDAALYGNEYCERDYKVPLCIKHSDSVASITFEVDANDANCEISCGWQGWVENI